MQDKEAPFYQESLFGRFLKVYAPETFLNVFTKKGYSESDQIDFIIKESIEKAHYDLIVGIILNLEKPHNSFKRYSHRNTITKLEALLLRKLLSMYKHPKRDALVEFPRVVYTLRDQRRPLKVKYAPENVALRFNTSNVDLYKATINLIKLNYLETMSGAINQHTGWKKTAAIVKAPASVATAPLTLAARGLERVASGKQARIMRRAKAVEPKRLQLILKIKQAVEALKKMPTKKAYKKYVGTEKTPYTAYKPTVVPRAVTLTLNKAGQLPQRNILHEPMITGKKKRIQEVYPIPVPQDPETTEPSIDEPREEMVSLSAAAA